MAHEMGHYVLGHVVRGILVVSTLTLIGLYLVHLTANRIIVRYRSRIGFDQLSDVASLPLLMLLMSVFSFLLTPLAIAHSRSNEHESDRFALELTRDNYAGASAFVKLFEENLAYPRPHWILQIWQGTHPTLADRVEFCNSYAPWKTGGKLKYEHLFAQ
jgi:Zn-dependent protease with chaperone function